MTVSRRIPVLFGGLALAAASLLAPDEARARDECGTLDAQGAATCSDQAYAGGIRYDLADSWNDGIAGPVTLTVTGGSATTISAPASPPNVWTDGAIVVRTAPQGSGDSTSRAVALTVGSGSNAVRITEHATQTNHGIIVFQFGKAADAAAVTLGSGVVIGTSSAPMKHYGVHVLVTESTNTAAHSIASAATIHSQGFGLLMDARGSGSTRVTNSGSITTYAAGGNAGQKSGIRVLDWTGTYGDDRTADTTTTVTNSGSVAVGGANTHGVHVDADGLGLYKTVNSGTVSASGAGGGGIYVNGGNHAGAAGSTAVEVENTGAVTASGANGWGIFVRTAGAGNARVTSSGAVTASGMGGNAVHVGAEGAGSASIAATGGRIEAKADGIHAAAAAANTGGVTVDNAAAIDAGRYGIVAWNGGTGAVRIENSGAIESDVTGIQSDDHGTGGVTIENSADVTGDLHGIFARKQGARGGVTVTHSAGEVSSKKQAPIAAYVGRWQREDAADSPDPISTADVKVEVTGGTVTAPETMGKVAVEAINVEGGSVEVSVSKGATLTARHNAGIYALLADRQNTGGTISVVQGGTISARKGVYAAVARAGTEARAADAQPLIDVAWTGTFTESAAGGTVSLAGVAHAVESAQEAQAGAVMRGAARTAGIDAEVLSWRALNRVATRGDDPGEIADAAAQAALLDTASTDAATKARAEAIVAQFRTVLNDGTLGTIPGANDIDTDGAAGYSAAEIRAYLSEDAAARRTLLRDVLARQLSDPEEAVLRALATGAGLETALAGVTGASDAWKAEVRALAGWYNVGNVRVAMTGGAIDTRGDGIRAWYAKSHDMNGAIAVTVAEGARVTGGAAGIYVANAGLGLRIAKKYTPPAIQEMEANRNLGPDDLVTLQTYRNQVVRVDGTVTGGSDAAVHLAGGGALIVDGEGKLVAGAGRPAVLVNDPAPAIIYIAGRATGSAGSDAAVHLTGGGSVIVGLTGRLRAGDAPLAIRIDRPPGDTTPSGVVVHVPSGRAAGLTRQGIAAALEEAGISAGVGGNAVGDNITVVEAMIVNGREQTTTVRVDLELDSRGVPMLGPDLPNEVFSCETARPDDNRCRLYRALPSALLAMTGLPSRAERMSAARDGAGGWALVEATSGKWTAAGADTATAQDKLTYRHSRFGIRAGADVAATGENVRLGVSAHGFRGSAKTPSSGTAKLSGAGLGVYAAAAFDDGLHVDAQAAATWYDVDVDTKLASKDDAKGRGYAASLELGRRFAASGGMTVVPRAGLLWSSASLDSFEDVAEHDTAAPATVSVKDASRLTGSVGVGVESVVDDGARLFGSLDVSQELSGRMEASVSEETLKSTARKTTVRAGVGGLFDLGDGASLRASAGYATAGGGNDEFGGGLSLDFSF